MRGRPLLTRFWERVSVGAPDDCWLWTGACSAAGYGQLGAGGRGGTILYAHRISAEIHLGPIPDGLHVLHRCDTPACVNPAHLSFGTHRDNMADARRKGRNTFAERHGQSKLTAEQAREIKRLCKDRAVSQHQLARRFAVTRSCIAHIAQGLTWQSVDAL